MSELASAFCGNHPGVSAVDICARCGTFLCGACVEYFRDEVPVCANCLPLMRGDPPSVRSRLSPLLGFAGVLAWVAGFAVQGRPGIAFWALGAVLSFVGLSFAVMELRLIRHKQVSARGRPWAIGGVILSLLGVMAFAGLVVTFLFFLKKMMTQ